MATLSPTRAAPSSAQERDAAAIATAEPVFDDVEDAAISGGVDIDQVWTFLETRRRSDAVSVSSRDSVCEYKGAKARVSGALHYGDVDNSETGNSTHVHESDIPNKKMSMSSDNAGVSATANVQDEQEALGHASDIRTTNNGMYSPGIHEDTAVAGIADSTDQDGAARTSDSDESDDDGFVEYDASTLDDGDYADCQTPQLEQQQTLDSKQELDEKADVPPPYTVAIRYHGRKKLWDKPYTVYLLEVDFGALAWDLYRRYSQFADLHQKLKSMNSIPSHIRKNMPKLPPRKLIGNLDAAFIEKRREALHQYMYEIVRIPEIACSAPCMEFVGALENHDDFGGVKHVRHRLHFDEAMSVFDTGDIILFQTQGVLQAVTRTVLSSAYDHVALVVRTPASSTAPSSLQLLEATAEGVRSYPLRSRLRAWSLCETTLVLRRLNHKRPVDFRQELEYVFVCVCLVVCCFLLASSLS
jgi:PX domain